MNALPVFLTAQWRALVMLNYAVDPALLAPFVPAGTQLDAWHGRALASIVGFRFLETRVRGFRIPFHADFDEVNLRCYIRREGGGEVRRAVVFIKEIVPRRAIAWVANTLYGENYIALPMRHEVALPGTTSYSWRHRGRWDRVTATTSGAPSAALPGSEEEFITEHYWGYARQRDGGTVEYQVEHPRWNVWRAASSELDVDIAALYGEQFAPYLRGAPSSAFVADGSAVIVRKGARLSAR